MKATITDQQTLNTLIPSKLEDYLSQKSWERVRDTVAFSVWERQNENRESFEVLLPKHAGVKDFALRMSDVLQTLEVVEQRSQLDIFRDIGADLRELQRSYQLGLDTETAPLLAVAPPHRK